MYSEAVKGDNSFLIGAYYYYCSLCLFIWPETALATREKSLPPPPLLLVFIFYVSRWFQMWILCVRSGGAGWYPRVGPGPRSQGGLWYHHVYTRPRGPVATSQATHWRSQKFYKGGRGRDRGDSLHIFFFFFKMSLKKKSVRIVMWIRICIMGDLLDPYTGGKILPKMCQKTGWGGHRPWCPSPLATPVTASAHSVISLLGSVSDLWFVFKKKLPKS